jgi:hypothetical protein
MEQNPFVKCVDVHSILPEYRLTFIIYLKQVGHITFQNVLVKLNLYTNKTFGHLFIELKIKIMVGNLVLFLDLLDLQN